MDRKKLFFLISYFQVAWTDKKMDQYIADKFSFEFLFTICVPVFFLYQFRIVKTGKKR